MRATALAFFLMLLGTVTPPLVLASCIYTGDATSYQTCLAYERTKRAQEQVDLQRRMLWEQQQQRHILERMEQERGRCTLVDVYGKCKCWSNQRVCDPW